MLDNLKPNISDQIDKKHSINSPNSAERYNDIAIIKTIQPMRFSDRVYPFCVPSEEVGHNTPVTVQGYGLVNEST